MLGEKYWWICIPVLMLILMMGAASVAYYYSRSKDKMKTPKDVKKRYGLRSVHRSGLRSGLRGAKISP